MSWRSGSAAYLNTRERLKEDQNQTEAHPLEMVASAKQLLEDLPETAFALGGTFGINLGLSGPQLPLDVDVVFGHCSGETRAQSDKGPSCRESAELTSSDSAQVDGSLLGPSLGNQPTGRLRDEEATDEQQGRWEELNEDRELPLEAVAGHSSLDTIVDPKSTEGTDLNLLISAPSSSTQGDRHTWIKISKKPTRRPRIEAGANSARYTAEI